MQTKRWTLFAVILGSGMVFLESSIVAVALPKMGDELSSTLFRTLEAQAYIYYGYLLTLSALLVLAGGLNDFYGRKRMFVLGLIGFGVTSVICALAPNMEVLLLGRVLQGAAGALLVPGSLSIITSLFEGEEQGRAFGLWAGASAATTILGPVIGGALVAYISWRAAFWINVPFVLLALWATVTYMPETKDDEATGRFDWFGSAVVGLAVGGLTFGAIRGQSQQWEDPVAFVALAIGVLAAVAFPISILRSSHPVVPPELFKSRNFTVTNISTLLVYGSIYVLIQYMSLFLVGVLGYDEIGFGLATIPLSLFLALFSSRFGKLSDRYGPRLFMAIGPALMGLGILWFVRFPATSAPWKVDLGDASTYVPPADYLSDVLPAMTIFGLGLMVMVAPLTTALMRSVPVRNSGVASAFNNAISRAGPQLAGALLFIAITTTFYAALSDAVPSLNTGSRSVREQVAPLNPAAERFGPRVARAADEASTDAFQVAMLVAAVMCFAGAAVNAVWIRNPREEVDRKKQSVTPCPQSPAIERSSEPDRTPAAAEP